MCIAKMLQKVRMAIRNYTEDKEDKMFRYFNRDEFACKCGCGMNEIDNSFITLLDNARELSGKPYIITSGYRCENHPLSKQNPTSSHIRGLAADIKCDNSELRAYIVGGLAEVGFNRLGIAGLENGNFIHVDCDDEKPAPRIWCTNLKIIINQKK